MGWNYRKSVNLGGGVRLNFSKSGIGISGGVKGFRISSGPRGKRLFASIPGTGIYYTKSLGSNRAASRGRSTGPERTIAANNTASGYQYMYVVRNDYTGETRELRARTQFELNQLVMAEHARQAVNEQRQRQLEVAKTREQQVTVMNQQLQGSKYELGKLLKQTVGVNDRINWGAEMITQEYPPLNFTEKAPRRQKQYKLPFFKSLFMNEKKFEIPYRDSAAIRQYEERRGAIISDYLKKKAEFDKEKNRKNGELAYLKRRFEESDKEAIERYVSIVLTRSQYPADFEHDFDVKYDKEKKRLSVDYIFQNIDSFPVVDKYVYNRDKNAIEEILMEKDQAMSFYTGILFSVGIRTIHEVFESVYTDAIDIVCFNGYIEDEDSTTCAFSMRTNKDAFGKMDLNLPIGVLIKGVELRAISDFATTEQVTPFE